MTAPTRLRRLIQAGSLGLFLALLAWPALFPDWPPADLFLRLDPFLALGTALAGRILPAALWPAALMLLLTPLFGRFFCGWICPMGTTIDLADAAWQRPGAALPRSLRLVKHALLTTLLAAALLGVSYVFLASPLSLVTRLYGLLAGPLAQDLGNRGLDLIHPLAEALDWRALAYWQPHPQRFATQLFILVFFGGVFALGAIAPRFWCRVLCPAGALFALCSRRPATRRRTGPTCRDCGRCARTCPMGAIGDDPRLSEPSECLVCANCQRVCPTDAIAYFPSLRRQTRMALPGAPADAAPFPELTDAQADAAPFHAQADATSLHAPTDAALRHAPIDATTSPLDSPDIGVQGLEAPGEERVQGEGEEPSPWPPEASSATARRFGRDSRPEAAARSATPPAPPVAKRRSRPRDADSSAFTGAPLSPRLSRRVLLASGAAGAGLAALGTSDLHGLTDVAESPTPGQILPGDLIRPPGALPERDFLARCVRCGECMALCPTNTLQPTWLLAGLAGMFSPRLVPRRAPCEPTCHACGRACPTGAIRPLPPEERKSVKVGTAMVLRHKCLAWEQDKRCVVCDEVCPYKAVRSRQLPGRASPVPVVDASRCAGCGYCEHRCPAQAGPAIVVGPQGAMRLGEGSYRDKAKELGLTLETGRPGDAGGSAAPETPQGGRIADQPPGFTSEGGATGSSASPAPGFTPEDGPPGFAPEDAPTARPGRTGGAPLSDHPSPGAAARPTAPAGASDLPPGFTKD